MREAEVGTYDDIKSVKQFRRPCMRTVHMIEYKHGIVHYILSVQAFI